MASLCLLGDDGLMVERWEIGDEPLAVGRDAAAEVTIADGSLSRRHFLIMRTGQDYLLKDLESQNGTWVDGRLADTVKLHNHDCILAGRTLFLFSELTPPAGTVHSKPAVSMADTVILTGRS
jgi:pSer/pThr/pTyr-binding forkhead associated (FHA) protein